MFFPPVDSDWLETTMQTRNAALIALAAAVALLRFGRGVMEVIAVCAVLGLAVHYAGA